jgi:hypothetical protein
MLSLSRKKKQELCFFALDGSQIYVSPFSDIPV